jgi:hypothetical protein
MLKASGYYKNYKNASSNFGSRQINENLSIDFNKAKAIA